MNDYVETRSQPLTKVMVLKAYGEVRANKGRAGVDGMTWAELDANLQVYLYALRNRLNSGSFFHAPVLQVEIPKKSGLYVHWAFPRCWTVLPNKWCATIWRSN